MDQEKHPSRLLTHFSALLEPPFRFEFSKYIYKPQSTADEREYFSFTPTEAVDGAASLMNSLRPEQELAFHSRICAEGEVFHVPMLDLACNVDDHTAEALLAFMARFNIRSFELYRSGRSGHVYGLELLPDSLLTKFFAHALLLNLPGKPPLVDSRWIGHRLYAGYGSLRWSCNTKQYLQYPHRIGRYSSG